MEPTYVFRILTEQIQMARLLLYSPAFSNAQPMLSSSSGNQGMQSFSALSHSLLGRMLALSPIPEFSSKSVQAHFSNLRERTQSQVEDSKMSIQERLHMINGTLFAAVKNLVRHSATRQDFLNWLATMLVSSKSRTQMGMGHPYQISFSGDASSLNLSSVLIKLCEPFLVTSHETPNKLRTVDAFYALADHPQCSYLGSETRLGATSEELLAFLSKSESDSELESSSGSANDVNDGKLLYKEKGFSFVTQIFFLTMYEQHVGVIPVLEHYKKLNKLLQDLKRMQAEAGNNQMAAQQMKSELERNLTVNMALDAHLISDQILDPLIRLNMSVAAFVNGLVDPQNQGPPLTSQVPFEFRCLPEFIVEDLCEFFSDMCFMDPARVLSIVTIDHLIRFIILLVGEREYIRNPFLRSKLASVLHGLIEAEKQESHGLSYNVSLASILRTHTMAKKHLVVSLAKLFADVEHTGRSGQFYERFAPRHEIATIFEVE
eukprot:TRINITY_DN1654_c0_g1_i5.p1 TRINITY_DN1654_c0_g1~~TRINITY_DN1654_c0_g1_i5.p1  ORF type:complete len:489 (+),score=133.44 TRINITY_DN1654_c0_g1_i5:258-1724(+)